MNKTQKHQLNLKNKLIAAIAMLLVSSIMMVSSTYAWFTLSTKPEVQGITTTVGANGNLEIALANPNGDNTQIGSAVGDANENWLVKNMTWGNLLDLSDPAYGLDQLTLLPSRLNISGATATSSAALNGSPLYIPVYGTDGRISALDGNKMNYGAKDPNGNNFLVNPMIDGQIYKGYGVRALGTSSTQSETELNFQTALNAVNKYRGEANGKASGAIFTYGTALADMAVMHAAATMGGGSDTNDYKAFIPQLQGMINELDAANELIESALINALIAVSNSNVPYGEGTIGDIEVPGTDGKTMRQYMADGETLGMTVIWGAIPAEFTNLLNDRFPALSNAYNTWADNNTKITNTQNAIETLAAASGAVTWSDVSPALSGLMNTNYVTINGTDLGDLTFGFIVSNASNLNLEMADGSGVLANFGKLTGNLSATVELSENATYEGESLAGFSLNLITTSEPAGGALLTQIRSTVNAIGAVRGDDETSAIDVVYGYVLDFVFRTNAANSNLLLQTDGAQRIYGDATNAATQGLGSNMTFAGSYSQLESLVSMMSGIRVVFTSTDENSEVYGIAKAVFEDLAVTINAVDAERIVKDVMDGDTLAGYEDEVKATENAKQLTLALSAVDNNGNVSLLLKLGDHQYITVSEYQNEETEGKDYLWTVKTAMWYEKTTQTEVDGAVVTTKEEIELVDKDGNLMFYPTGSLNDTTGEIDIVLDPELQTLLADGVGGDANYVPTELVSNISGETVTVEDAVLTNYEDWQYYVVSDVDNAAVEVEAPLYLHTYTVAENTDGNGGKLVFGDKMAVQTLTGLDQNVIKGVSALVYLDGDYVDNSDVVNSETGISNTGSLNLQFASSANLVPMENTALKDGKTHDVNINKPDGVEVATAAEKASEGMDYVFALASDNYDVSYSVENGEQNKVLTGEAEVYEGVSGYVYTIPAQDIVGEITITITEKVATP